MLPSRSPSMATNVRSNCSAACSSALINMLGAVDEQGEEEEGNAINATETECVVQPMQRRQQTATDESGNDDGDADAQQHQPADNWRNCPTTTTSSFRSSASSASSSPSSSPQLSNCSSRLSSVNSSASTPLATSTLFSPSLMSLSTLHGIRHYNNSHRGNAMAGRSHLNGMLLMEAERRRQVESYEEMKRLLVFAGIFFLFAIAFILMRFRISIDDVFKWSPVIWLLGVINCGLLMNLFVHLRKFFRAREMRRERHRRELLLSLNLPNSFPCLAPPGTHCCHQHQQQQQLISRREMPLYSLTGQNRNGDLPSYDQISQCPLLSPPAFVLQIEARQKRDDDTPPPDYRERSKIVEENEGDFVQQAQNDPEIGMRMAEDEEIQEASRHHPWY